MWPLALKSFLAGQAEMHYGHTEVTGVFGTEENSQQGDFCVAWSDVAGEDPVLWLHMGYPELPGCLSARH